MKKLIALLALTFLTAPVFAGEYPDISIPELNKAIAEKKVTVIDVNGSSSYAKGHVPSALDYAAISKDFASKLPADKNALVVAYCGGPSCQAYVKAADAAKELGYTNVKHLSAGISGWLQANQPTEPPKK
jgi:rhodanese-related sulfurtransferase